jgi:hypothetical protein
LWGKAEQEIAVSDEPYLRLREQAAEQGEAIEAYVDRLVASTEIQRKQDASGPADGQGSRQRRWPKRHPQSAIICPWWWGRTLIADYIEERR